MKSKCCFSMSIKNKIMKKNELFSKIGIYEFLAKFNLATL